MSKKTDSDQVSTFKIDLTNPEFSAPLLKTFGNSGFLSYPTKIILLSLSIFIIDIMHAYWINILDLYLTDYIRFVIFIVYPIVFILFIHVSKEVDTSLQELAKVFSRSSVDFKVFVNKWRNQSKYFYYFCICIITIPILIYTACGMFPEVWIGINFVPVTWLKHIVESGPVNIFTYIWLFIFSGLGGVMYGIAFNRLIYCVKIIDDYGNRFIKEEKINLKHAVIPKQISTLSRLALKIDLILTAPTFVCASIFFNNVLINGKLDYAIMGWLIVISVMFVFFAAFPLRNLHKALKKGKKQLLDKIDNEITEIIHNTQKGFREFSQFNDILLLRDRVNSMSTWGVNNPTFLKFALTFFMPIILGALFQVFLETML